LPKITDSTFTIKGTTTPGIIQIPKATYINTTPLHSLPSRSVVPLVTFNREADKIEINELHKAMYHDQSRENVLYEQATPLK
jgi:hypothetical protein